MSDGSPVGLRAPVLITPVGLSIPVGRMSVGDETFLVEVPGLKKVRKPDDGAAVRVDCTLVAVPFGWVET